MIFRQRARTILLGLVFIGIGVLVVHGTTKAEPVTTPPIVGKHFLWRGTDAPVPFYMLGSSHALRATDYPLGHEITDAIAQSHRFLFEFDLKHDAEKFAEKLRAAAR